MTTCKRLFALSTCMLLSAASVVQADTTQGSDVQAELSAMRSRIAQLEGQQNDSWLNERRAEEVKSLVREVLSDADTRSSMADGGATAGYNNGFFLASEDGKFLLRIGGQIQFRYVYSIREGSQDGTSDSDKNDGYFKTPRTKLFFDGHIADPRIQYHLVVAANYDYGDFYLEEYSLSYAVTDTMTVYGGQTTSPLVRGDIINSTHTLGVDRGTFETFYGTEREQGVGVIYNPTDALRIEGKFVDSSSIEYGFIARADYKFMGDWDQIEDFSSWSGEGQSLVAGIAGAFYEGSHGVMDGYNYYTVGVADVSYENNGFGAYFAAAATNSKSMFGSYQTYGLTAQGNYMIVRDKLEAFVRYDYIDRTDSSSNDINLATIGLNYYMAGHNAKFSMDIQYGVNEVNYTTFNNDLESDRDGNKNQTAIRGQVQVLF